MIQTKYGPFDGNSWQELCQLIFKMKYGDQNYQEMPASPGDFGIEGFIKNESIAIQCYCPNLHYTQKELYEKQRDKITDDLKKLKNYEEQIKKRIGLIKIKKWVFLTPIISNNDLLAHAQSKQSEIISWNLSILGSNFEVVLQDADFYAKEIHQLRQISGKKLVFLESIDQPIETIAQDTTEYEKNISRKNEKRCHFDGSLNIEKHARLNELTSKKWTDGDRLLKKIEKDASEIYFQIIRVINQYESEVEELCITWRGDAETLISKVRNELADRITEAVPLLGEAERYTIADHMTSKWLALCPLEIE